MFPNLVSVDRFSILEILLWERFKVIRFVQWEKFSIFGIKLLFKNKEIKSF